MLTIRPPKVVLLARSLERTGGAEQQLVRLAIGLSQRGWLVRVVTFYPALGLAEELAEHHVPIVSLGKRSRWDILGFGWRLIRELRRDPPDILQSTLTPPNVFAALLPRAIRGRIVWGIRASNMDTRRYDWTHRAMAWLESRLAKRADLIICNSEAGRVEVLRRGFPEQRLCVVPNGIDTERFCPDRDSARALRDRWLGGSPGPLIGLVARIDPMKDHRTFLKGARRLADALPTARFVCLGARNTPTWPDVKALSASLGLDDVVRWEDPRSDMPNVYNALDLATLTSVFGEGFPNVVGEAMACGIPVVATRVGDCDNLIGDCGVVVLPGDAEGLAAGWKEILQLDRARLNELGRNARARIQSLYSVQKMVDRTVTSYLALAE